VLLTPWRELNLEWEWSGNQLIVIRVQIDRDLFSRTLINGMLDSKRPKDPCDMAPLRTLSKLDPSADTTTSAVTIVVAIFEVLNSSIVWSEIGVVGVAVRVKCTRLFVLGMVERPLWDYDGCVFGLELWVRVVKYESREDRFRAYDEHTIVPVILCAAVGDAIGSSVE
jgi:hypothetical protein